MANVHALTAALLVCVFHFDVSHQSAVETRLIQTLLKDYSKDARPVKHHSDVLKVNFGITILGIQELNPHEETLRSVIWLNMNWKDQNLAWNESDYDGIQSIRLSPDKVFIPDILLFNSVNADFANIMPVTSVVVSSNGDCLWVPGGIFKSACGFDPTWYPFDEQICTLKFGSWTYDGGKLDLQLQGDSADVSSYNPNSEWELIGAPATRSVMQYDCCPENYLDVTFKLTLRRQSRHSRMEVFLPPALLSLMSLVSFALPVACGERITLGIIQLVSMGGYWVYSSTFVPHATSVTFTDVFYFTLFFGSLLSFFLTALVIKTHHNQKPMPGWLQTVFSICGRMCFMGVSGGYQNTGRASFDGDTAHIYPDKDTSESKSDWVIASKVLDRLFFTLYLIFFIVAFVCIFISAPR